MALAALPACATGVFLSVVLDLHIPVILAYYSYMAVTFRITAIERVPMTLHPPAAQGNTPLEQALHHLFNLPPAANAWQRAVDHEKALASCLAQLATQYGRDLDIDFADTKGEIPVALKDWQQRQGFGLGFAAWMNTATVRKGAASGQNLLAGNDTEFGIHHQELEALMQRLHQSGQTQPDQVYVQDTSQADQLTVPVDHLLAGMPSLQFRDNWLDEPCLVYTVDLTNKHVKDGHLALDLLQQHAARLGAGMRERLQAVVENMEARIANLEKHGMMRDLELEERLVRVRGVLD